MPNPSYDQIGLWLACLAIFIAIGAQAKQLFVRKPSLEQEFVTRKEFDEFKAAMREDIKSLQQGNQEETRFILAKLDEVKADIMNSGERRAVTIHERINDLQALVHRVDERTSHRP